MICPACAHENRPGAKFCEECAAPLKRACASCGSELRPTAKFCDECGTPATGAAPAPRPVAAADTRKVVTIIFGDLVGSTALHERLDAESVRQFMESYYAAMRGAVEAHGGRVTQVMGDGVKAVFGAPRVAEDDAIRAVRAGVAMQDAFRALAEQQRGRVGTTGLRVAVNTGEVVANDATEIIGDPVNVAARLQEQGKDGDVVVGESTHRLVSTLVTLELLGSFALKGRAEAVKAYRVVSLERPAGAATAPFVGRVEELSRLTAVYETSVEKPAAGLVVLLGSPGLGKSRLIDEFARRHADAATVVQANCDAAGGATFAPLADALREGLGIEGGASAESLRATIESALPAADADRARIAGGIASLLAGSPASPEETFFVVRRLLGALAQTKPVVLVIDDLHWAEPLLLDLVEHLIQWGSGVPLFVLIGARPELRDLRSSLVTPGGIVSDVVTLSGLDAGAAMRLAANVIGAADLPAAIAAKVLATSEGNPLFVGELVRMLVQEGALTKDGDRWAVGANLAALEMPPTIHALLAARIERLRPEERLVLERAAVVGRHFSRSAVAALLPGQTGDLDARLEALRRTELIERDTGWLLGEPVLRFHHVLIRDAAYRRLLKGTRAELHAQLADWIEAGVGDAAEHDETIGWHLEQAHQFLRELGPLDAQAQQLGARAATRLAAAGRRALARDDVPVAADLLGRAIERLDADDPARADLALDCCEALLAAGDVGPAAAAIEELGRLSAESDRLQAWHVCFAGQHQVLTAPSELHATVDAVASAAEALAAQDDAAGEAKAHYVHALALSRLGKVGACEAALDRALAAARRAGDRRRANTVLAIAPLAALWGPSPVTRASGRCLDVVRVLRITQGAPAVEAVALSCQGVLEALRGRTEAAGRMIASARRMVEELGITQRLLEADVFGGLVELLEGDAPAAERSLRGAYGGLRDLGLRIDAARAAALLARAVLAQDRVEEAETLSHESEALAGDDLKAAIAWRGVRAEALARRGEPAAAVELASQAVEIAAATDALLDHADARLALAAALRAAGRGVDADAEERRAQELWEAKGATLLAERVRSDAARVEPPVAVPAASTLPAARRRAVRPNFATEEARRIEAAVAARDVRALETVYRRDVQIVDHPHGVTYGYEAIVERLRSMIEDATDAALVHETLATFGDELALSRLRSTASGSTAYGMPVGSFEVPYLVVIEADEQGSARRIDIFGEDKLDDAVALLYERHAALLPEGAERARAEATAHSFALLHASNADPERLAHALAPDLEGVDHRHLSSWSLRGAEAYLAHLRALHQVAADVVFRREGFLALAPNATLSRVLHRGTDRAAGGVYERAFLSLFVAGADGRIARAEWFDDDREAEALARFEALVGGSTPSAPRRRVRPNAASAIVTRFQAAFASADSDGLAACFSDSIAVLDHPTGASYGRDGHLESLGRLARATHPRLAIDVLGTIGDTLVLCRRRVDASGTAGGRYDVGAWERAEFVLFESDAERRIARIEIFADDRLADAIARLYERHAELSPEGPAREQAAATARTVAALLGPPGLDAWRACLAAGVEFEDHRILGFGSLRGREAGLPYLNSLFETSESLSTRIDDVLALEPHAFLVRWTESGVAVGGGDFERVQLTLWILDGEGRVARLEYFDVDRDADALARFEALAGTTSPPGRRRVCANAATEAFERGRVAIAARDGDALAERFDESLTVVHHPTRATYGRRGMLTTWRSTMRAERLEFRQELLASLGETLALDRHVVTVDGLAEEHLAGFGASVFDQVWLLEVDERGHWIRLEIFAPDRLGDAVVRLYELYADRLPEGPACTRAAAVAHAALAMMGPIDLDRMAAAFAPEFRLTDHRVLATWSAESGAELVAHFRHHLELAPDFAPRIDDVLVLDPRALVVQITFVGTARDSGGAFENRCCVLYRFGADGRIAEIDCFEAEQETQALARFDALFDRNSQVSANPFANAASRFNERFVRAWDARDWNAIREMHRPTCRVDDRRRIMRIEGPAEDGFRFFFDQPRSRWIVTPLATRGERLVLSRLLLECDVEAEGGAAAIDYLCVDEVDADGRSAAMVVFDLEDEDAAYAELDARFLADPSETHGRTTVAFDRAIARRDWDAVAALCSPAFVEHDHRSLAVLGTTRGAEAWIQNFRALVELAPDTIYRTLHARGAARGFLSVGAWLGSREGGRYEIPLLAVCEVDARGAIARADLYEPDQREQALARFRELEATVSWHFGNAASRANRKRIDCFNARDWAGVESCVSADLVFEERRRLLRNTADRRIWLAQTRLLFDLPASRFSIELLATRGERLSLHRHEFEGTVPDGGGPLALDPHLALHEVDADGRIVAIVLFDLDDEQAAFTELDARWLADGGAAQVPALAFLTSFDPALARRDWDAVVAGYAPAFVGVDHRLVGWGTLQGPAAFLEAFRTLVALAPDVRLRWDHGRTSSRGLLAHATWLGTRDGGAFENPFLMVGEFGADGRILRADFYDVHHVERARARFEEIESAAPPPSSLFANAASRAADENCALWMAAEWDRFANLFPADFRLLDRRRNVQLELGRDETIAFSRSLAEHATTAVIDTETLATRGERLALQRWRIEIAGDDAGPSEISHLDLLELDERGLRKALVRWDDDAIEAAYDELDARFEAGEGAGHPHVLDAQGAPNAAIRSRDWDELAARCAPTFRMRDHRLLGWGTMVNDAATFVRVIRSAVELAPDARYRNDHVRICARGTLLGSALCGTREGGAFENPFLRVTEVDAQGRILSHDLYDTSDFARALARFEEIRAGDSRDPHAPTQNAASAAMDRWQATYDVAFDTGDWEPMRALCAPGHVFDDRRRLALLSGDSVLMIASARERVAMGARPQRRLLGTAGDRVAIETILWSGGPSDGPFEIEYVGVIEADAAGLISAFVLFDADDGRAAQREAWARWAAIEPDVAPWVELLNEIADAWNAHDVARLRALFAEDLIIDDHRLAGVGRIEGADAYLDSFVALWDLAPDQRVEFGRCCAIAPHGAVLTLRRSGTLESGGPFENDYAWLGLAQGGRITRLELFEVAALDAALARLEELQPDPLRIPPNAVTRIWDRWDSALQAGDMEALRAFYSKSYHLEDRRRLFRLTTDREMEVASVHYLVEGGWRSTRRLLAVAGEHIALQHVVATTGEAGSRSEVELLELDELDAEGRFTRSVLFDAEDRAAAQAELFERYVASGAEGMPADGVEFVRAFNAHDGAAVRAVLTDDFVFHDRRRTGAGRLAGADAYLPALAAIFELSADVRIDTSYWIETAPHGRVGVGRTWGTHAEGGAFEMDYVSVIHWRGDRVAGLELFELEDREAALARLEELRPDPLAIPPNAATRARERWSRAVVARDWDAVRGLVAPGFVFEDRGRRALVRGDVETWIASADYTTALPGVRIETPLVATTGDRVSIDEIRWAGSPDGDGFEFGRLRVIEVDAEGRFRTALLFDPEDRAAAFAEAQARFLAGEAAGCAAQRLVSSIYDAFARRDLAAFRERLFAPDFVYQDRRTISIGRYGRDDYVDSVRALMDLAPDVAVEELYTLTWNEHGRVVISRLAGTFPGGGPFERPTTSLWLVREGRLVRYESFESTDAEQALARFAELCAG